MPIIYENMIFEVKNHFNICILFPEWDNVTTRKLAMLCDPYWLSHIDRIPKERTPSKDAVGCPRG